MIYDALKASFQAVKLPKQFALQVCGIEPKITELIESEHFCIDEEIIPLGLSEKVSPKGLSERLKQSPSLLLIDVRSPVERQISEIAGAIPIPLEQLNSHLDELEKH